MFGGFHSSEVVALLFFSFVVVVVVVVFKTVAADMGQFVRKVEQIVSSYPLVMFSKTTCGYCSRGE